mmetsp:Transcript_5073/g.12729  ORF Transcript_5073/g.12729 Transcript_5073/m.12729 type:complete len:282 (-) Transcript_5073:1279-2124(-)
MCFTAEVAFNKSYPCIFPSSYHLVYAMLPALCEPSLPLCIDTEYTFSPLDQNVCNARSSECFYSTRYRSLFRHANLTVISNHRYGPAESFFVHPVFVHYTISHSNFSISLLPVLPASLLPTYFFLSPFPFWTLTIFSYSSICALRSSMAALIISFPVGCPSLACCFWPSISLHFSLKSWTTDPNFFSNLPRPIPQPTACLSALFADCWLFPGALPMERLRNDLRSSTLASFSLNNDLLVLNFSSPFRAASSAMAMAWSICTSVSFSSDTERMEAALNLAAS